MSAERSIPVKMSKDEFKKVGHYLIDSIADFFDNIESRPVTTGETGTQLRSILGTGSLPENGISAEMIMKRSTELLYNHSLFNGHPKFLGYITSSATSIGALADLLSAAVNPNVGANILSPMATEIEKQTIRWLAELIGVSPESGGILVSGGNMANFTAFVAARTAKAPKSTKEEGMSNNNSRLVVYCSTATHTWIEKAAFFFGLGTKGIRWIGQQENGKISLELLEQAIIQDLKNGYSPMMVIGNAGDVSTGAVDDLKGIGIICKKYSLWFHIDGAYGAPAAVIPGLRSSFDGMADADSIAIDPHKWLYSPLEAGCTLVKDPNTLIDAYSAHPVYYNFSDAESQPHNYYEYGFQNSRGFRALKVWAALQHVGKDGYIKMIGHNIELAQLLFRLANQHPELEAMTQNLSITTLRFVPSGVLPEIETNNEYLNKLNEALLNKLQRGGKVFLSNAVVRDKYCLRGCIVNFRTSENDIEEIVKIIVSEGRRSHDEMK
jgi:aromatic-L-amino-acid/L-tryptophan decarboxylase